MAALLAADPELALVQLGPRPRDPAGRRSRDWVPRLRVGDPARSSEITVIWEGAVAIRRAAFEQAGGWPAEFRFVHEGVDLGWRLMDAGLPHALRGRHRGAAPVAGGDARTGIRTISVRATASGSRAGTCRCRSGVLYVVAFALRSVPRFKTKRALQEAARGYRDGTARAVRRRRLRARTLVRMTRAGRPPIM